jgi:TetR/AcrR family transcriptional regulator, transcriptional repressor for nem operon
MRASRQKAAESRERILDVAARLFREKGFGGAGLEVIMQGAGLTHGGFYGHFQSKEQLAAEAVARALQRSGERQSRFTSIGELVADYLTQRHCEDRANGCALAALGADIARQSDEVRRAPTLYLRQRIDQIAALVRGEPAKQRQQAIATLAGLVGALTLARAVDDPALAAEVLEAAREVFSKPDPALN